MINTVSTQINFMNECITKLENTVNPIQMKLLNVEALSIIQHLNSFLFQSKIYIVKCCKSI